MKYLSKPLLGTQLDWSHPLNKGLVGFWLFNEGGGDKVKDLSMNGNTGTITAMASPKTSVNGWNPGRKGVGLNLAGIASNSVDCGNGPSLTTPYDLTYAFWALNPQALLAMIMCKTDVAIGAPGGVQIYFRSSSPYFRFFISDGSVTASLSSTTYAPDNNYHFFAISRNDVEARMLIDGVFVQRQLTPQRAKTVSNPLTIGRNPVTGSDRFLGSVDQACIWNRALSDQELKDLYINPYQVFK